MATYNLEIRKGFDRENDSGCKVSPRTIFDGQIPYKSLNFINCHKINITYASNMKTCNQTKVWVPNLNLGSKFS